MKQPTREQISYTMSKVRSTGSAIEVRLGGALWKAGFRYRKHYGILGKPDYVLVSKRIAIFCDSEFWHGYRWPESKSDFKSNRAYWLKKIGRNRKRDKYVNRELRKAGWIVLRFWEHEIVSNIDNCVRKVRDSVERQL